MAFSRNFDWVGKQAKLATILAVLFAVTFGYCPYANAQGFSVGFGNREFTGKPGDTFQGRITVKNISDVQSEFSVSLRDKGQPGVDGNSRDGEPIFVNRSLVPSITFSPTQLSLEPGESGDIAFEVIIPDDPMFEGCYWGSIAVKKVSTEKEIVERVEDQQDEKKIGVGINLAWEYVVLVYATIEGTEIREATFSAIDAEVKNGSPNIIATLKNLGNIHLRPDLWMEVHDVTGQLAYKVDIKKMVFLPERERKISMSLAPAELPPGEYMVMVIADYGVPQMIAAQARVTVSEEMANAMAAATDAAAEAEEAAEGGDAESGDGGAGEDQPEGV